MQSVRMKLTAGSEGTELKVGSEPRFTLGELANELALPQYFLITLRVGH
jgi:hypothetical protein